MVCNKAQKLTVNLMYRPSFASLQFLQRRAMRMAGMRLRLGSQPLRLLLPSLAQRAPQLSPGLIATDDGRFRWHETPNPLETRDDSLIIAWTILCRAARAHHARAIECWVLPGLGIPFSAAGFYLAQVRLL